MKADARRLVGSRIRGVCSLAGQSRMGQARRRPPPNDTSGMLEAWAWTNTWAARST